MIFTRHSVERYRQFHMLDRPAATDEDARTLLVSCSADAVRLPDRNYRNDEVWTIHALGIEIVVKRDADFAEPVCVTVLPPARFRGLTPLQAEIVADAARAASERAAEAEQRHAEMQVTVAQAAAESKAAKRAAATARSATVAAEATARKADAADAQRDLAAKIREAKNAAMLAQIERDVLLSTLKTMRMQLACESRTDKHRAALMIAVRALRDVGATEALDAISAIDPGLASDAFARGPTQDSS